MLQQKLKHFDLWGFMSRLVRNQLSKISFNLSEEREKLSTLQGGAVDILKLCGFEKTFGMPNG